jgi:hypothetical protein
MKPGDLVRFVCNDPRDIGMVMRIYDNHPDLMQRIDVLWDDGVNTQDAEDLEVVSETR